MGLFDTGKKLFKKAVDAYDMLEKDAEDFIELINEEIVLAGDENGVISPLDRRIIYVFSDKDIDKISKIEAEIQSRGKNILSNILSVEERTKESFILKKLYDKLTAYPVIDAKTAKEHFEFQANHPEQNTLYGMCDIIPDYYVPISSFHKYIQEKKHNSFLELCASLGAKEIYLEYAEIENTSYKIDASGTIPTQLGELGLDASIGESADKNMNGKLAFKFSEKNKDIKEYQSEWIDTEPTWKSMKKMRIENHVESYKAEFNYSEDYGITGNVAAKCTAFGINIGGEFKEMKKTKLKYHVLFWQ